MVTEVKNTNYWILHSALYIQLNAMGEPDYIQCSVVSGASILCYMSDVPGLGYDAGHNYQRWTLAAYPSIFPDSGKKYIYVAIPRVRTGDNDIATLVFPSQRIDIYGKAIIEQTKEDGSKELVSGDQIGNEDFYYIYLQGIISEVKTDSDNTRKREWEQHIDFGSLATDEALASGGDGSWWKLNTVSDTITFLKTILKANFEELTAKDAKIIKLALNGKDLTGVADNTTLETSNTTVVTPQYLGQFGVKHFLAKDKDDTAHGTITFENVQKFLHGMDIGDNAGQWTREGVIAVFKFLTNNFEQGLYGHGAQIDEHGNMEANSIFARQFISAPKFVFNEISVTQAEQWNTNGYGTIKSVDRINHTITLKLEENDYGSLSVGDICRGIYADIENTYDSDANNEGEMDECGFTLHRGFFTTYFYVKKIITAEKGKFVFEYGKRSERTPDPCAFMDFAQYGSFTDEQRQSSMYFCSRGRSYIEVLDGVNTWEIQAENRVTRYGWLGGLRVKKTDGTWKNLKGNGLFAQNNVYFGGNVEYLGDILGLDDLKNEAKAYDVSLSQYQSVVTVDDMGNVINGLYTQDESNATKQYRISTAVFVRKGVDILLEEDANSENVTEGHYRLHVISDNCDVEVKNSTVFVKGIRNIKDGVAGTADDTNFDYAAMRKMSDAMVTIVVDLEGKTSKTVQMPIRIQHDSLPFMVCDLSNENASVAWNTKTAKYIGLPITTKVSLMYHNTPWDISDLSVGAVNGLKTSISLQGKEKVITIDADNITSDILEQITKIPITVVGVYAGVRYEYTKELTILRSADMIVYDVVPSVDSVVVDKDGNLNTKSVSCKVYATSSDDRRYALSALPSGYQLKYGYGDTADTALALGGSATASTDHTRITFALYDNKGSLLDQEMVPIVSFGKDGKGIEYIFKRTTDSTPPDNPTPSDWRTNAEYLRTDKEYIPTGWTDDPTGVDAVNLYEWVSKRVSVNGHWGEFSDPAEYAHFGKHAAKATLSDYTVTIPTDSEGNSIAAFSEDISCTLVVDGKICSSLSVSADSLPSGVSINGTNINVSYAKGYALGKSSKVVKVKVSGKLDNSSYSDTITLTILPNISGMDGKGIEYIFKRTTNSTPPSNPTPSDWSTNAEYLRTDKEYVPSGWTDDPTGVDAVNLYEWVSKRVSVKCHWGAFSDPAEYAHFGKHAARATLSDYIVTIPTDPEGNSIAAFSEDISCTLFVDGNLCSSLSVSADSLPSGVTISGTTIKVSYAKGYAFGRDSKVVKVKVSGKLDNASYSDTITLTILPNVSGVDGDGYEYVFYLSNSSTPPSKPSRYNGNLSDDWVDDPPSPTDDNRYVYVSYYEGKVGAPNVAQDLWSAPVLWAYKAPNGKDGDGLIVGYQSSASEPSVLPTPKTLAEYDEAQDDIGHGWTKTAPATGGKSIVLGGKITTDEIIDRYNSSTSAWGTEESEILLDGINQNKTFYKTPSSLGDNGKCIRRIKVINHFQDSYLRVMLKSYSETNWDLVCISRLYLPSEVINNWGEQIKEDSEYLSKSKYAYAISGNGQSLVENLSMPDAGEYYFFIGYFKDGSTDSYGDYGLFAWQSMIALTESLWRTDGTVDSVGNITWSKAMPMQAEAIVMERAYIATANDTVAPAKPYRTNGILRGGWTAKRLAVSSVNRFIWESVRTGKHGTDSVQDDWSQPVIVANFAEAGKMGKNGCIVRNSEGWKSGATYHNDSALTLEQKYIDLIYIEDNNANDGWSIYQCNVTHTATGSSFDPSATDSDGNRLWIKLSDVGPMYSPLIVGKNAVLKFAQGQQFNLMEGNNIFGSFRWVKDNADYAFWIGGTSGDVATTSITRGGKFKTTNADITGKITATSGQIAGMKISGLGLTNEGFNNEAYIVLRNDILNTFAGIGYSVTTPETGMNAVACFTNEETKNALCSTNYAMFIGASGAFDNVAIGISGGYISGLRIKNAYMSSGGSTYATAKTIDKNVHSVLLAGAGYYQLPKMEKWDDGYVIFVKRTTDSGEVHLCSNVSVTIDSVTATDKVGTSIIYYDRGSVTTDLKIESLGDAMMLVYHRDMSFTVTENNKEKKYDGGWIQYKCPRDW